MQLLECDTVDARSLRGKASRTPLEEEPTNYVKRQEKGISGYKISQGQQPFKTEPFCDSCAEESREAGNEKALQAYSADEVVRKPSTPETQDDLVYGKQVRRIAWAKTRLEQAEEMRVIASAEVDVAEKELVIARQGFRTIHDQLQTTLRQGKLPTSMQDLAQLGAELKAAEEKLTACKKRKKPGQNSPNDTQEGASMDEPKSKIARTAQGCL